MIKTIIYDISESDKKKEIATINFSVCAFPQRGDNLVVDDVVYVVQRKEYIALKEHKDTATHSYMVGLQVKKYIPEQLVF